MNPKTSLNEVESDLVRLAAGLDLSGFGLIGFESELILSGFDLI